MSGIDVAFVKVEQQSNPPPSPIKIPSDVIAGVAIANMLAESSGPAAISNLAIANTVANNRAAGQNAVTNQQAMQQVQLASTASAVSKVQDLQPLEARSSVDVLTNNELAQTLADMKATLQAMRGQPGAAS